MAVDRINQVDNVNICEDSYNRCIAELRARYSGRGVSSNFRNEMARQAKKEESAKGATESYVLFDSRSKIGDGYRSGEYNGSRYMTSDDFVRYFKSRRAFYMPTPLKTGKAEGQKGSQNSAVPRKKSGAAGGSVIPSESGSKESHTGKRLSALKELAAKWFPVEAKEGRVEATRFRFPAAAVSGIAVFVVSLGMIVGGSVMVGSASAAVGELNSEISALEAEQADLEGKLDLKYNINDIERDAKALGMIKREYADNEYIESESHESIEIYGENEDEETDLAAALLSAFGIELD